MNGKKRKLILRLFCLVFSVFIWLYVISSAEVEIEKNIPLKLELPENYAIVNKEFSTLNYRLKGPRVFVRNILEQKKEVVVNLKDYYKKGQKNYTINLEKYQIPLPIGVQLVNFEPKKVKFKLEKSLTKKVPVILNYEAETLAEYDLQKVKIEPKSIEVTGARSVVKKIKQVATSLVEMKTLSDNEFLELDLILPNKNVKLDQDKVRVNYQLNSKLTEFTFTKIPIIFHTSKLIKKALPNVVNVAVKGNKDLVEEIQNNQIEVIAKVPSQTSGKTDVPLKVKLPPGVELLKLEPESISVLME